LNEVAGGKFMTINPGSLILIFIIAIFLFGQNIFPPFGHAAVETLREVKNITKCSGMKIMRIEKIKKASREKYNG